ncbi:Methyltransferase domain-containing protein [Streptomyces sp. 3214.6]|nr:class I SAM-dependent methyltransferase [Streptomyces sp. 3214.6]SHI13802.1 Methyltransferase domain-containing protein [Streptomyces sp. 3214.6]
MPVPHDIAAETELWDAYAESAFKDDAELSFCWTQYSGHGPGPELLGTPESVLEIGCGTGRALAHLAQQGVKATGVDLSPRMVQRAGAKCRCGGVPGAWAHRHADRPGHGLTAASRSACSRRSAVDQEGSPAGPAGHAPCPPASDPARRPPRSVGA